MQDKIDQIANLLTTSRHTVVVTGAGISTEAGIPDFRGENGIYRKLGEDQVMEIIHIDSFRRNPERFYEFYRKNFIYLQVKPSRAHYVLAEMEEQGYLHGIVTQNIDNLHQKAGSKNVIPVHGNAENFVCVNQECRTVYPAEKVLDEDHLVPHCPHCGSVLKPDVVLFGENIYNYMDAQEAILSAQLIIVIGSSLAVYPLAGFVRAFDSFKQDLVIINKGLTYMDHAAMIKIDAGTTTSHVLEEILGKLPGKS